MVDFVEICNVCARKAIIEAAKRIINSGKVCHSYSDFNFGVTFFGTQCILIFAYNFIIIIIILNCKQKVHNRPKVFKKHGSNTNRHIYYRPNSYINVPGREITNRNKQNTTYEHMQFKQTQNTTAN